MNYLIDGHNLIGQLAGLSLSMPDDEEQLVQLLNRYGEQLRGKLEVYFDKAPSGQARTQNYGRVQAHFVTERLTADEAIRSRLKKLGKLAPNWTVVSSDRSVQAAGHEMHAGVLKAEDFARQMIEILEKNPKKQEKAGEEALDADEVEEWLRIFKQRKST